MISLFQQQDIHSIEFKINLGIKIWYYRCFHFDFCWSKMFLIKMAKIVANINTASIKTYRKATFKSMSSPWRISSSWPWKNSKVVLRKTKVWLPSTKCRRTIHRCNLPALSFLFWKSARNNYIKTNKNNKYVPIRTYRYIGTYTYMYILYRQQEIVRRKKIEPCLFTFETINANMPFRKKYIHMMIIYI